MFEAPAIFLCGGRFPWGMNKKAILGASDVSLSWQPQSNMPAPSSSFEQTFHSQEVMKYK